MACTLAESLNDPLHRKLRQLRCLRRRFDCYRVERTSSQAGVSRAEVQRLSRRTFSPTSEAASRVCNAQTLTKSGHWCFALLPESVHATFSVALSRLRQEPIFRGLNGNQYCTAADFVTVSL